MGRDVLTSLHTPGRCDFYSHALVGRDDVEGGRAEDKPDFYSHALVGRDGGGATTPASLWISTHTPSWGVTDAQQA